MTPQHIVLIPDGNRRWARAQGLDTLEGHAEGFRKFVDFVEWCRTRGIRVVTAFGFSTENWNRTEREVSYLLKLFEQGLVERFRQYMEDEEQKKKGVRVRVIGQKERFPESLRRVISEVEEGTKENDSIIVNIALSYGGRWDILQAAKQLIAEGMAADDVTEEAFSARLSTGGLPDPDLVIRTSGEQRISNFLLWQMAYAELHFVEKHWPAFTEQDLEEALAAYENRHRRFGQ